MFHKLLILLALIVTVGVIGYGGSSIAEQQQETRDAIEARFGAIESREAQTLEVIESLISSREEDIRQLAEGYDRCAIGWLKFQSDILGVTEGTAAYCYTAEETHFGTSTEGTQPPDTDRGGAELRGEAPSGTLGVFNEGLRGEPSLRRIPSGLSNSLGYPEAGIQGE